MLVRCGAPSPDVPPLDPPSPSPDPRSASSGDCGSSDGSLSSSAPEPSLSADGSSPPSPVASPASPSPSGSPVWSSPSESSDSSSPSSSAGWSAPASSSAAEPGSSSSPAATSSGSSAAVTVKGVVACGASPAPASRDSLRAPMAWLPSAASPGILTVIENFGPVAVPRRSPVGSHRICTARSSPKPAPSTRAWLPAGPRSGATDRRPCSAPTATVGVPGSNRPSDAMTAIAAVTAVPRMLAAMLPSQEPSPVRAADADAGAHGHDRHGIPPDRI